MKNRSKLKQNRFFKMPEDEKSDGVEGQKFKKMPNKFMLAFNIPSKYFKQKEFILYFLKSFDFIFRLKSC